MTARRAAAAGRETSELLVSGEFALRAGDFKRIAEQIHHDAGIYLPETKATLVYARLAKRLRELGLESFTNYCDLVASPEGEAERHEMLAALTTNVTRFFREEHHFEHLRQHVLPEALASARRGGSIRFWSAACSSGQEPYSIALTILDLMPEAASHDIKVLATDIDPHIIAKAREGSYPADAIDAVPERFLRRHFAKGTGGDGGSWRISDEVKSLVSFRQLNLIGQWPMKKPCHAIFCRNVVIYFDEPTQHQIWSRFVPRLVPGGWLYIGHSERVSGPASAQLRNGGITAYQLNEAVRA